MITPFLHKEVIKTYTIWELLQILTINLKLQFVSSYFQISS